MSKELKNFLVDKLLPYYSKSGTFDPSIQEEFLDQKGYLDKTYVCMKAGVQLSTATFRKVVKDVFGVAEFSRIDVESTISKDEFMDMYEFGKFNSMRSWVGVVAAKGELITREEVFNYIAGV